MSDPVFFERRDRIGQLEKIIDRVETPDNSDLKQGYLTYHISFDYPEKGWRNDYAVTAVNNAKRLTICWIRFLAQKFLIPFYVLFLVLPKIRIIEKFLQEWCSAVGFYLTNYNHEYYLKIQYYCEFNIELKKAIKLFLEKIGVNEKITEEVSFNFVSFIEYDTAYRYRLEDLFSETTVEKLITDPAKEIKRLVTILADRDPSRPNLVTKFKSISYILSLILWIPKIKRAFVESVKEMNFEKLQLDEMDRYHVKHMIDYKFFGMPIEERFEKWPPQQHTWMELDYRQINDQRLSEYIKYGIPS